MSAFLPWSVCFVLKTKYSAILLSAYCLKHCSWQYFPVHVYLCNYLFQNNTYCTFNSASCFFFVLFFNPMSYCLHFPMPFSRVLTEEAIYFFFKRLFFPPLNGLGTLVKTQLHIDVWMYFWTLESVPLSFMSVLCQSHALLLILALESAQVSSPPFFSSIVFAVLCSLNFHLSFRISLSLASKKSLGILMGMAQNL